VTGPTSGTVASTPCTAASRGTGAAPATALRTTQHRWTKPTARRARHSAACLDSSTLASGAVASEFGPSLHTLAPDEDQVPASPRSAAAWLLHLWEGSSEPAASPSAWLPLNAATARPWPPRPTSCRLPRTPLKARHRSGPTRPLRADPGTDDAATGADTASRRLSSSQPRRTRCVIAVRARGRAAAGAPRGSKQQASKEQRSKYGPTACYPSVRRSGDATCSAARSGKRPDHVPSRRSRRGALGIRRGRAS
jgi:hypothetical protein